MADYILSLTGEKVEEALDKGLYAVTTTPQQLSQSEQEAVRNNIGAVANNQAIQTISRSGTTFTATMADGITTFTFTQQDTNTWQENDINQDGYVTGPQNTDTNKVWKTNAEGVPGWRNEQPVEHYSIVDTSNPGLAPVLPSSSALQEKQFLRGDATWADIPEYALVNTTANGLCPILPTTSPTSKFLNGAGQWEVPPNTTYERVSRGSNPGLCPGLPSGDTLNRYLREDGNWEIPLSIGTGATNAAAGNHTHTTTIGTSTGTNQITLAANTKYAITAGGTSFVFTTPPDNNTTYSAGTGLSLSGTTFNHSNSITATSSTQQVYPVTIDAQGHITSYGSAQTILAIGTSAANAAAGNHTHATSIAPSSGTNQITLAASTRYAITAGGTSYIFTTPPNTTYSTTSKSAAGLCPALPNETTTTKYLRQDGTWQVPPDTNTTYSAGTGISISSNTINNSGVRSIATGSTNGTISVNTNGTATNVAVKGLGTAAYTASTAYAAASHNHAAGNITSGILTVERGGTGVSTWTASAAADYTTAKPRAIIMQSSTPSSVTNGYIVLVYS